MRESRTFGSARGAVRQGRPYRDRPGLKRGSRKGAIWHRLACLVASASSSLLVVG
jgi:hypothetical protein